MFSVIFEVHPRREKFDLYLDLAKGLKPILEGIDGFIDNERFESARRPGWILSHSTWRDEKSVVRWRTVAKHQCRPEIVITDVVGWSLEGFEWIRRLVEAAPRTRIVVYSSSAEERHVIAALTGGATAYILKQGDGQMLLLAVDAALQGHMILDSGVTPTVLRRIRSETAPFDRSAFVDLTHQEARLVALL